METHTSEHSHFWTFEFRIWDGRVYIYEYDEWLKWDRIFKSGSGTYEASMERENHNPRRWRKIGFRVLSSQKDSHNIYQMTAARTITLCISWLRVHAIDLLKRLDAL
ncbi:hypothetical protein D5086_006548 [Populus alba]|uniref:Uncharacterized protein n=1 Tax=Populus alba TaxID=43335 RepID=A0ACC4CLB3_POPAL